MIAIEFVMRLLCHCERSEQDGFDGTVSVAPQKFDIAHLYRRKRRILPITRGTGIR